MGATHAVENSRYTEAGRLITLARGMLASDGNVLAVTHLDLAFDLVFEKQQAESDADSSAMTGPERGRGSPARECARPA